MKALTNPTKILRKEVEQWPGTNILVGTVITWFLLMPGSAPSAARLTLLDLCAVPYARVLLKKDGLHAVTVDKSCR